MYHTLDSEMRNKIKAHSIAVFNFLEKKGEGVEKRLQEINIIMIIVSLLIAIRPIKIVDGI